MSHTRQGSSECRSTDSFVCIYNTSLVFFRTSVDGRAATVEVSGSAGGLVTAAGRDGDERGRNEATRGNAPRQGVGWRTRWRDGGSGQVAISKVLPTFRTWLLRKLSSSSAVAVKSCFAIASIFCPPRRRSRRETTCRCCWRKREGARYTMLRTVERRGTD